MSYIPDGVTEYDTQPDPLNKNRASRIRFAAACLPLWIGMGVLAKLLFWLHQPCAQGCNLSFGPRIGGAMGVFVLATFTLLRIKISGWNAVATMPSAVWWCANGYSKSAAAWRLSGCCHPEPPCC